MALSPLRICAELPDFNVGTCVREGRIVTERDFAVLAFERRWWKHAGAKEEAIRHEFGLNPTAYYQLLSRVIDDPAAFSAEPALVGQLREQRASRHRQRR